MAKPDVEIWDGRLIAAARALCGLPSRELARIAGVSSKTVVRLEGDDHVMVSETHRHGCTSRATWSKIVAVLEGRGIELFKAEGGRGAGVRWKST